MSRDDLSNEAHATNVTFGHQISNVSSIPRATESHVADDTSTLGDTLDNKQVFNGSSYSGEQLYESYNPEVGVNTAAVLGGLLVVLVVYVVYRTQCRKRILKVFQKCTMKYFPEEYPDIESQTKCDQNKNVPESNWISEGAKLIWEERASLSKEPNTVEHACDSILVSSVGDNTVPAVRPHVKVPPHRRQRSRTDNCVADRVVMRPPDCESNPEHETASWVQNVRSMDMRERQLNGIILKIPPDLVSHNVKCRTHFHSVTEYGELDNDNISCQINKSLPSLVEQQARMKAENYANVHLHPACRSIHSCGYVPLATQESVNLDDDSCTNELIGQLDITDHHGQDDRVPLDICPVVKVQHYHSRSKRRLTSLCNSSSDDINSCSSDEPGDPRVCCSINAREAKYMRLQTNDNDTCFNGVQIPFAYTMDVGNCNNKHTIIQRSNETEL